MIDHVRYYARFTDTTGNRKTPRYTITEQAGYFEPMKSLIGKDGAISMNLLESENSGIKTQKNSAPVMRLQAKGSLNFTGLRCLYSVGVGRFAYGYPYDAPTYGSKNKENPLYPCRFDAFLFVFHPDAEHPENKRPAFIEMVVLRHCRPLAPAYFEALARGSFDKDLNVLRGMATPVAVAVDL